MFWAVLTWLQYRTKVAIKMSRAPGKARDLDSPKPGIISPITSDEEDEEEEARDTREETPDLYRNSALGMYGGVCFHISVHPQARC